MADTAPASGPAGGSARLLGLSVLPADNPFTQGEAENFIESWYGSAPPAPDLPLEKALKVFRNAGVERRFSAVPISELAVDRPLEVKNGRYIQAAIDLGSRVVEKALVAAGIAAAGIDLVITLSCTGFMIPALDAFLMNRFEFRPDTKRLPVNELGCAAGVAAFRLVQDHLRGRPEDRVLVLSVELPTLTFQPVDFSGDHIVSCAIFGDGAAAAIFTGTEGAGLTIRESGTRFFPGTLDFMGYDLKSTGFHIRLSPAIPRFIRDGLVPVLRGLVGDASGRVPPDVWLVHPGGPKILDAVEESLGLGRRGLSWSRGVLRRFGNLSSTTIFFILDDYLKSGPRPGERQGFVAVGPGFGMDFAFSELR